MPNYIDLWNNIKDSFAKDDSMSKASFGAWVETAEPISLENHVMKIKVLSSLHRDYWTKHLLEKFVEYAYQFTDQDITPEFITEDEYKKQHNSEDKQEAAKKNFIKQDTQLNSRYTFDTFVIGSGNQMAHAAAMAVSDEPGVLYNPLFFYGGVGLGKTHLMHAIGHQMLANDPNTRVMYVTSEAFTNDFINSIQKNTTEKFHEKYRNVDLLLVDDIQFFADKEATQEEFFHTFEALYNDQKQIVLTSDRLPNDIPSLQDRLVSRFQWGLSIDITPPNLETRIAILREKAQADKVKIPDETLEYIATRIDSNIRELEGAMARIQAYAKLQKADITTELAADALRSLKFDNKANLITIAMIQEKVATYFHVSVADIKGKKRMKSIVIPRQIAMYLSRELTDNSLPKIGAEFGGKDHTTVIHSFDKIKDELENNEELARQVGDLRSELKP